MKIIVKASKNIFLTAMLLILLFLRAAFGHELSTSDKLGIVERTGVIIPKDITLHDEHGVALKIGDIINKPTILSLVYLTCDHVCPQLLGGLAVALPGLKLSPGKDYQLVTVSFDEHDDSLAAASKKANYTNAAGMDFPVEAWKFLTGDRENIARITEAVGFHFKHDTHGFIHPVVLVFISSKGVITGYHYVSRYQYGAATPVSFSAAELMAGLSDAIHETPRLGVTRSVLYCFTHQPERYDRFFNLLAITGIVTLLSAVAFFFYLRLTTRRRG
ncbi:MAG TPA: SCO family protein [Dissulfurispiraceae bacterium]|nr:SCO family protein [Dissulfurispiraceae bacterium]